MAAIVLPQVSAGESHKLMLMFSVVIDMSLKKAVLLGNGCMLDILLGILLCLGARMRTAAYGSLFVCLCVCVSVYYCYNCSTVEMQV